jgi:sugar lactone lactonase YvrE
MGGAEADVGKGIEVDAAGNVYVADFGSIRKITPVGVVTSVAGTRGLSSESLTIDGAGNIYAVDRNNAAIRKIAPDGTISTLATGFVAGAGDGIPGNIASDSTGNVYITNQRFDPSGFGAYYYVVSKVTPQGVVSVLAGSAATPTLFRTLQGIAVDKSGIVYVADSGNHSIFRITASGTVTTLAGQPNVGGQPGTVGTKLGPFPGSLTFPSGLAVIVSGVDSKLLAVDMDAIMAVTLSP